jgi:hypothetical protein
VLHVIPRAGLCEVLNSLCSAKGLNSHLAELFSSSFEHGAADDDELVEERGAGAELEACVDADDGCARRGRLLPIATTPAPMSSLSLSGKVLYRLVRRTRAQAVQSHSHGTDQRHEAVGMKREWEMVRVGGQRVRAVR